MNKQAKDSTHVALRSQKSLLDQSTAMGFIFLHSCFMGFIFLWFWLWVHLIFVVLVVDSYDFFRSRICLGLSLGVDPGRGPAVV